MNQNVSTLISLALACCSMAALSAPPVAAPPAAAPAAAPPMVSRPIPLQQPFIAKDSKGLPLPRTCLLGSDCLTMDSHPFEICQVSTRNCGDKLAEVLEVDQPKAVSKPAPRLQRTSR
jgi:hypothetical protein